MGRLKPPLVLTEDERVQPTLINRFDRKAESIGSKPCESDTLKWPPNGLPQQQNRRGASASHKHPRLDRWGRSLLDLVVTLKELAEPGVAFVSSTEALD